jgi:hypothetical protein
MLYTFVFGVEFSLNLFTNSLLWTEMWASVYMFHIIDVEIYSYWLQQNLYQIKMSEYNKEQLFMQLIILSRDGFILEIMTESS